MILEIPLQQVPNQTFGVTIQGAQTWIDAKQRGLGDMYLSDKEQSFLFIIVCQNNYLIGQFIFTDISGTENPAYTRFNESV